MCIRDRFLVDHKELDRNLFFFLHEAKFKGRYENIKPDFTLFINGIPVAVIEVKRRDIPASEEDALIQIRDYEFKSPWLFNFVQIGFAIGEKELYTPVMPQFEDISRKTPAFEWKLKDPERSDVFDLLEPSRLLEMLRFFTFFLKVQEKGAKRIKIIARWNQYKAVKKMMDRVDNYVTSEDERRKGLIWHWQGSGKTFIMLFAASYFFNVHRGKNPVIFFVVDRRDLESQHGGVFSSVEGEEFVSYFKRVESIAELKRVVETILKSQESKSIIPTSVYLTTLQKFNPKEFKEFLRFSGEEFKAERSVFKREIMFLIDEVHRGQYGDLAAVMRAIFPNAMFFGFTGTPVFKRDRNTFQEFSYPELGEYFMDVYFISDSIRDGFTLPIIHEVIEEKDISLAVDEDKLKAFIEAYAEANPEDIEAFFQKKRKMLTLKSKKLLEELRKSRVFLESDERIRRFAEYIAGRIYEDTEGFKFKAMVVAVNRVACVKFKRALDEAFKKHFCEFSALSKDTLKERYEELCENAGRLAEVVMTYQHADLPEIEAFKSHLKSKPELQAKDFTQINRYFVENFLEKDYPKVLIVTDMLLTGFDAPVLKVMYLDKPIFEHRLLQAVARVNRPYPEKKNGLIVDSIGLLKSIAKTTAIYEMLAMKDEKVLKELGKVVKSADEKLKEFEEALQMLKEDLRGWDIDVDKIKEAELKQDHNTLMALEQRASDILNLIALRCKAQDPGAMRTFMGIRETLSSYKALGAHPGRLVYLHDMEVIGWLYKTMMEILRHRGKAGRFWDELLRFIHENMDVGPFERVLRVKIEEAKSEESLVVKVSARFFKLYNTAEENASDPVYKVILERLKMLLEEWINRNLDLKTFLDELKKLEKKAEDYEKSRKGKTWRERILESLRFYIKNEVGTDLSTDFEKFSKELSRVKRLTRSTEKKLSKALFLDLQKGSGMDARELSRLVDKLMEDSIIPEVKRHVD